MKVMSMIVSAMLLISITACNDSKKADDSNNDTTVIIHKEESSGGNTPTNTNPAPVVTQPAPTPVAPDWRALMKEYHDILCRGHKNASQPNDKIRQAELVMEINNAKGNLSKTEKVYFTTEMARTVNMNSCK